MHICNYRENDIRTLNIVQFKFYLLSEMGDVFEPGISRKGGLMG